MQWYTRKEVVPRTKAICLAGLTETDLAPLCTEFATTLSHGAKVGTVGTFTPLCEAVCYHSCGSSSNQDRDGYDNCKSPECADTLCSAFLLLECPSSTHTAIQALTDRTCYAGMPLPPPVPQAAAHPPSPPFAPPPLAAAYGKLRLASAELPSDEDCAFVTYEACRLAAVELGTTLKLSTEIEIQLSACERGESVQSCFLGCSLGASSGAPATYSFLTAQRELEFGKYMHKRCAGAPHEYCLCGYPKSSPPPPPTVADETEWQYAAPVDPVDNSGHATAFYKWVADDVRLPENLRSSPIEYSCPGVDTGSAACARHCSGEFGDHLVAFSVTGIITSPSPPTPPFPPSPPVLPNALPPPPPPPVRNYAFHGATDACRMVKSLYSGPECRDGGVGSVFPALCPYGTMHRQCGPRQYYAQGDIIGDDSCASSGNGVCEDGGYESVFYEDDEGVMRALCGFAQDRADCPPRYMESLGDMSFSNAGVPPGPTPPPTTGTPPPPPASSIALIAAGDCRGDNDDTGSARAGYSTRFGETFEECSALCVAQTTIGQECTGITFRASDGLCEIHTMALVGTVVTNGDDSECYRHFFSCLNTCVHTGACSDGGLGAVTIAGNFLCPYGTMCASCGARTNVDWVGSDTAGKDGDGTFSRDGKCDDVVVGGSQGYGTDQVWLSHSHSNPVPVPVPVSS